MMTIRLMSDEADAAMLSEQFRLNGYRKPEHYYFRCLEENESGKRITLLAYDSGRLAGCCHLLFQSGYPPFREHEIPEINDLNVFPEFRRRGIATQLFDEFERIASMRTGIIGVGVGMYADYGPAQRMYAKRGYVPDGRGLYVGASCVKPGEHVRVDDELVLYWIKELVKP